MLTFYFYIQKRVFIIQIHWTTHTTETLVHLKFDWTLQQI